MKQIYKTIAIGMIASTMLSGCNTWSRLSNIGKEPDLTPIENPVTQPNYQPVSLPMPEQIQTSQKSGANSLWKKGSSGFFKDQRASKVGDILTVNISAKDAATLENKTEQTRDSNSDTVNVANFFGYESYAKDYFPDAIDAGNLVNVDSDHDITGEGKIDRSENINMTMAAIVTQILPNGNMVIEGSQEIEKIKARYDIVDLGSTFKDFSDTAAALDNLDLIISNDSSLAHLAGALGKKCLVLLPYVYNWRWHTDLSICDWYESVKIFKQKTPDDWRGAFDDVYDFLINLLAKKCL